jgi:mannose-1-phosphate guanylyltransferase
MNRFGKPWVIVLAGGSGERLRTVTASPEGGSVPKQFCRLGGRDSMLDITLARARSLTTANRIVVVVREDHRPWWEKELAGVWSNNILVHSRNRGTAIALLHALLHVSVGHGDACFVVLPSDHVVDDESIMRKTILEAVDEARRSPTHAVLIGAPAGAPDPSLGWIKPGPASVGRTREVMEFVEKPGLSKAAECVRLGAFRNTLILAGGARALLGLYAREIPGRVASSAMGRIGIQFGISNEAFHVRTQALGAIYPHLPDMDLGRDILQPSARWLRVLPLPECGWTDIGTLERLEAWWSLHPSAWDDVRQSGVLPRVSQPPADLRRAAPTAELVATTGTTGEPEPC